MNVTTHIGAEYTVDHVYADDAEVVNVLFHQGLSKLSN